MNSIPNLLKASGNSTDAINSDELERREFPHFMLEEIHAQPEVMQTCLSTYLSDDWNAPKVELPSSAIALKLPQRLYTNLSEVHIIASGTSRHAGLIAQFWLEQIAGIPTRIRSGTEFQEAPFPLTANTLTIGITQSGETADTLQAIEREKQRRLSLSEAYHPRLLGVSNEAASSLAERVDLLLPTLAGTKVGVAATKTFTTQLIVLYLLTLELAFQKQVINRDHLHRHLHALSQLPICIQAVLEQESVIQKLAQEFVEAQHCILLGRGVNRAIALEGSLKLKETTYLHAEGYAAGEFMHGPIALLDKTVPVIAIAPSGSTYSSILTNIAKVHSHGSPVIGIVSQDRAIETENLFVHQIVLPCVDELLSPMLTVVPLQLLAYHIAVLRGLDVDRPRNITKTLS